MEPDPKPLEPPAMRPVAMALALRIALYYLVFGLIWIVASDQVLALFLSSELITRFQTAKGIFFIFVTAVLLFLMVRQFIRTVHVTQSVMHRQVEEIARQYQMLFERSPAAMMIFEPDSRRILAASDVALELYGYSREEMLSMRTLDLAVEEERSRAAANVYAPEGIQQTGPWQVRRRDGQLIWIDVVTLPVEFEGRRARIVQITDVTERLRVERSLAHYRTQLEHRVTQRTVELSQANRQLRAEVLRRRRIEEELRAAIAVAVSANSAKTGFLANTSHEFRTPLTSILGYTDLSADAATTAEDRAKYLEIVRQNARHLLALIDDLLDLSRAEMGQVRVTLEEQSPAVIARQVMELLRPRASDKSLATYVRVEEDVPERIQTDAVRLRQILLNLLDNALKYTASGHITLAVRMERPDDQPPRLRFDVSDTGIGMKDEHLRHVFEPFFQVQDQPSRRPSGSGLGLAIAQQLARQMGGELTVQSAPGEGTTFSLLLPLRTVPQASVAADVAALRGHILLAEDNPNIRLLVDEYLTRAGARVTAVANGAEAVERVAESLSPQAVEGQAFDLVLLDLQMPVLDGRQSQQKIRELGYAGPVVGLSADCGEKTPADWAAEGWDAMATKPIDRQAFIPLLVGLLGQKPRRTGIGIAGV